MLYAGHFRIDNYKNIKSLPEIITKKTEKKDGVIFVASDLFLHTEINTFFSDELFDKTRNFFKKVQKQKEVFNNVEAIVLNGNIINNCFNVNQSTNLISPHSIGYNFFNALVVVASNIPVYYVRGDVDCFVNIQTIPIEFRGFIKFCNALFIDDILFMHGHNGLPFMNDLKNNIISEKEDLLIQEAEAKKITEQLDCKLVLSNSKFSSYKKDNYITVGSFEKNGVSVINTISFEVSF